MHHHLPPLNALKAIQSGQGVGLLPAAMIRNEFKSGTLMQVLGAKHIEDFAYYLVCPEGTQNQPKIVAFREWMLEMSSESATVGAA